MWYFRQHFFQGFFTPSVFCTLPGDQNRRGITVVNAGPASLSFATQIPDLFITGRFWAETAESVLLPFYKFGPLLQSEIIMYHSGGAAETSVTEILYKQLPR